MANWYRNLQNKIAAKLMESISEVEDGYMKHAKDIDGLQSMLRERGVIPKDGVVLTVRDFESAMEDPEEKEDKYGRAPLYSYSIDLDERGYFSATVSDEGENTVYHITNDEYDNHEMGDDLDGDNEDPFDNDSEFSMGGAFHESDEAMPGYWDQYAVQKESVSEDGLEVVEEDDEEPQEAPSPKTYHFFVYADDCTHHVNEDFMKKHGLSKCYENVLVCKDEATHIASLTPNSYSRLLSITLVPAKGYHNLSEKELQQLNDLEEELKTESESHNYIQYLTYDRIPENFKSSLHEFTADSREEAWDDAEEYFNGNDHRPSVE